MDNIYPGLVSMTRCDIFLCGTCKYDQKRLG